MGRPTKRQQINKKIGLGVSKLTPENIQKLEMVFSLDASITEICSYLDISDQTLINWRKKNPELFGKLDRLRERPVLKARQTVVSKLSENYGNAIDYLKRKKKLEFSERKELTGADGEPMQQTMIVSDDEFQKILQKYANDPRKKDRSVEEVVS